jgi:hypothetical protein
MVIYFAELLRLDLKLMADLSVIYNKRGLVDI